MPELPDLWGCILPGPMAAGAEKSNNLLILLFDLAAAIVTKSAAFCHDGKGILGQF